MTLIETKIKIEDKFLKTIDNIAKKENTTKNKVINDIIEKGIETKTKTLEDIVKSNPKIKFMKKSKMHKDSEIKSLKDMIGTIKAPKGFNPVEAVREVRRGEL